MTQHYREPCVIIADQPSLRCGDAATFFKMWNGSAKNCCLVYKGLDIILDHLSGTTGLFATPHTLCAVLYLVAMFIGC